MQCIRVPWLVLALFTIAVGVAFVFLCVDDVPNARAFAAYEFATQHIAEFYGVPLDALPAYDCVYVHNVAPDTYVVGGFLTLTEGGAEATSTWACTVEQRAWVCREAEGPALE